MWVCRASYNGTVSTTDNETQMLRLGGAGSPDYQLDFVPVRDVVAADAGLNGGKGWIALSDHPEFAIVGLERFQGRWVKLQFNLRVDHDEWSWASLAFDLGAGESSYAIPFPCPTAISPDVELVFNVPADLRSARLSAIARPGRFDLSAANVSLMGRPRAVVHMLRSIVNADGIGKTAAMLAAAMTHKAAGRWEARHRFVRRYVDVKTGRRSYAEWIRAFEQDPRARVELASEYKAWRHPPTISVLLPVFNSEDSFLRAALDSVVEQTYPNWELCIADDCSTEPHVQAILRQYAEKDSRIRIVYRETHGHISEAANSALTLATGDWIALLDHDDCLHPLALHFVAEAIARHSNAGLIYSDEDKIDESNRRHDPYFKCDFNYELFLAHNMLCHLAVFRRNLITDIGGFRRGFEGAQDYDLLLRAIEQLSSEQIVHIPRVLYHSRAHRSGAASTAGAKACAAATARRAIAEHLQRRGVQGDVVPAPEAPSMNRVRYTLPELKPKVSIVICTRDRVDLLAPCVDSIVARSSYQNYEVLIVDNGSTEAATFRLFDRLPSERFRVLRDESAFNFSALNNRAVKVADGEYVCLLNNDIEILTADWMEEMLSFSMHPDVGAVGARLWYPSGGLQHAGVILGMVQGAARHLHRNLRRGELGYFGRAALHQSFSAVTGAALMVKKSIYQEVGGLDENLQVAFNDIDFCLRVRAAGYRNVWTPYAEMIHHESASRGSDTTPHKRARAEQESSLVRQRWGDLLGKDPAYSLNLSIETEDMRIAWPPRLDGYQHHVSASQRHSVAIDA